MGTQTQVPGLTLTLLHGPGQAISPSVTLDFHQELGTQGNEEGGSHETQKHLENKPFAAK